MSAPFPTPSHPRLPRRGGPQALPEAPERTVQRMTGAGQFLTIPGRNAPGNAQDRNRPVVRSLAGVPAKLRLLRGQGPAPPRRSGCAGAGPGRRGACLAGGPRRPLFSVAVPVAGDTPGGVNTVRTGG